MARLSRRAAGARAPGLARSPRVLVVDIGNSETTLALIAGTRIAGPWRLPSVRRSATTIVAAVRRVAGRAATGVEGAVLGSVVPALVPAWRTALARLAGGPPVEVNAATARDLPIRYRDPGALGPDRIANAIGVRGLYGTPAIVVDLGTATTFDCVSRDGAFLGGIIAPGVGTSSEALFARGARLARVTLRRPARAMGRTTEEGVRAGVVWGHAAQVDALVRRLALEMRGTPHVIATGGWARVIAPECETVNRVDPLLTLKGMHLLWESVH